VIAGLLGLAVAGYAVAWLLQLQSFSRAEDAVSTASARVTAGAALAHLAALVAFGVAHRTMPLAGFGPTAATLSLVTVMALLVLTRRAEGALAGLFALPPIIALAGAAIVAGLEPPQSVSGLRGALFIFHVATVLLGYAILLVGSVAAAMYLLQFRALKQKEFGNVFRSFPSLETLDRTSAIALAVGLSVLTVGLVAGWSFTISAGRSLVLTDADVAFGLLTWAVYGAAIAVRYTPGGRGERAAGMTVFAFVASATAFALLRAISTTPELFL